MKLVKGVYENIISEQVSKDIKETQDEGLIYQKDINYGKQYAISSVSITKLI